VPPDILHEVLEAVWWHLKVATGQKTAGCCCDTKTD